MGNSLPWNLIFRFPMLFIKSVISIILAFCQESTFISIPKHVIIHLLESSDSSDFSFYRFTWIYRHRGSLDLEFASCLKQGAPTVSLHLLFALVSQGPPPEPHIYSGSRARVWNRAVHQIKLSSLSPPEFRITRPRSKYPNAKAGFHT